MSSIFLDKARQRQPRRQPGVKSRRLVWRFTIISTILYLFISNQRQALWQFSIENIDHKAKGVMIKTKDRHRLLDHRIDKSQNSDSVVVKSEQTKPDSFFFIHCPKTGTSLFTVLRNTLDACHHKNFTCFGVSGGGYYRRMLKTGKANYPFNAEAMLGPNISKKEMHQINTCNGSLPNCENTYTYHCSYVNCGEKENKVTMIRNPYKWLPSYANWDWAELACEGRTIARILPFTSQMEFTTNANDVEEAVYILQNNYSWWGITDYWEVSVCTFHCKFGGTTTESELRNTRLADHDKVKTLADFTVKVPLVEELIPNFTEYVDRHYKKDLELYSALLDVFWERASLCGCL